VHLQVKDAPVVLAAPRSFWVDVGRSAHMTFLMQHSEMHTSLLGSMTRKAFLKELPDNVQVEIRPCGSGFEVTNFGQVEWHDVFIELP